MTSTFSPVIVFFLMLLSLLSFSFLCYSYFENIVVVVVPHLRITGCRLANEVKQK